MSLGKLIVSTSRCCKTCREVGSQLQRLKYPRLELKQRTYPLDLKLDTIFQCHHPINLSRNKTLNLPDEAVMSSEVRLKTKPVRTPGCTVIKTTTEMKIKETPGRELERGWERSLKTHRIM
jgi:hypothetical protein